MPGQDSSDEIFIQGNTESQSELLGGARAAPGRIPPLGFHDGIDEFLGGSFGPGFSSEFAGEEKAVLSVFECLMKVQQGGGFQNDCGTA